MHIILYNPLSNKGSGFDSAKRLIKRLEKKKVTYIIYNLLDIINKEKKVVSTLQPDDIIDIVGGDGTLHRFVNAIREFNITNEIWLFRAGRGNDFSRDHKGRYFCITKDIQALPQISYNDYQELFINGCGIGIDAAVCNGQAINAAKGIKASYYKVAINAFKTFKQFKATISIDGKTIAYDDVWFIAIQNGRFFGGGMKVAPMAVRKDDHLDIVIVHKVKMRKLLLIFPLIFIGKHTILKKAVQIVQGKEISISAEGYDVIQTDGEVTTGVPNFTVNRFWKVN